MGAHGVGKAGQLGSSRSLRLAPGGAKCLCSRAAAEEARAVTRGERHRFVKKEKLGPAAAAHHLPVPPLVVENTNEPRLGRPAPPEQRFCCRVVDDPAVADEKAALRNRNDIAKRGNPVLQGSPTAAHQPLALSGGLRRRSITGSPSGIRRLTACAKYAASAAGCGPAKLSASSSAPAQRRSAAPVEAGPDRSIPTAYAVRTRRRRDRSIRRRRGRMASNNRS